MDQGDEIGWCVTRQCGFGKMRVGGKEVFRLAIEVGEIAAAAAGDEDLLADAVRVFEDSDASATFSGFAGAQQSRRAAPRISTSNLRFTNGMVRDVTPFSKLFSA